MVDSRGQGEWGRRENSEKEGSIFGIIVLPDPELCKDSENDATGMQKASVRNGARVRNAANKENRYRDGGGGGREHVRLVDSRKEEPRGERMGRPKEDEKAGRRETEIEGILLRREDETLEYACGAAEF